MKEQMTLLNAMVVAATVCCACGDDHRGEDSGTVLDGGLDASWVVLDAGRDAGVVIDSGGVTTCGPLTVCDRGRERVLPNMCVTVLPFTNRSAGIWPICIISPDGSVYRALLGGDEYVSTPGWTHFSYGNVRATASPSDSAACVEAVNKQWDAGVDDSVVCN